MASAVALADAVPDDAVRTRSVAAVRALVNGGADVRRPNGAGSTPLHLAVARGHAEVVALLLKYNARLDIRDKNGMTPLQQAETIKKSEIVTLIKQHLTELWPYLLISRR